MLSLPSGARIYLALAPVDMRKGFDGLAAQVQQVLRRDPFGGQLFLFHSRKGDRLKAIWWDGTGLCLFAKRLEHGRFAWPKTTTGGITMTTAQLAMLVEGLDWRRAIMIDEPQQPAAV
jgi:transposase